MPNERADAPTSAPIHPAPTITAEPPCSSRRRSASESSTVRRYSTPSSSWPGMGSRRGSGPVAGGGSRGGRGAGGGGQPVVAQPLAVVEGDLAGPGVEADRRPPEPQL